MDPIPSVDAPDQLLQWRKANGFSFAKAGIHLGVSGPTVQDWERRRKRPREEHREVLLAVVGIDPKSWRTDAERAQVHRIVSQLPTVRARPARRTSTPAPKAVRKAS